LSKDDILRAFETRIDHSVQGEFDTATDQVEKIALLRLNAILPEN
jgi:2-oxo-4-hydroxy-4-carboxy--5-ureidoimidazoline (OHCU) decarboxylase